MKVEQQVPLLLVERQALNEAIEEEKKVWASYTYIYMKTTISFSFFKFFTEVILCFAIFIMWGRAITE